LWQKEQMNDLEPIKRRIYEIRGRKIMLDADLAELYCVETRALNQAVKRNIERFPDDFMFPLTREEWETLKANSQHTSILTSQNVILKKNGRGQHSKYPPLWNYRIKIIVIPRCRRLAIWRFRSVGKRKENN